MAFIASTTPSFTPMERAAPPVTEAQRRARGDRCSCKHLQPPRGLLAAHRAHLGRVVVRIADADRGRGLGEAARDRASRRRRGTEIRTAVE
jgi:hypothetical protein